MRLYARNQWNGLKKSKGKKDSSARVKERKKYGLIIVSLVLLAILATLFCIDLFVMPLERLFIRADYPSRQEGELRVHFVDVGQGDCTILEFPDGKTMLVDGGDASAADAVLDYCARIGIETFDVVLLTHPDADHAGGLPAVLQEYGAEAVWMPYVADQNGNDAYGKFMDAVRESEATVNISQLFLSLVSDIPEYFYYAMILSPLSPEIENSLYTAANAPNADDGAVNDASAVLYVEYANQRLLLTGDASTRVEDSLVEAYAVTEGEVFVCTVETAWGPVVLAPYLEKITFLKAGHHGSSSSTGEALLELCRPKALFISAGVGNPYGHPSPALLQRVRAAVPNIEIYRTDELGNYCLTVCSDGEFAVSW